MKRVLMTLTAGFIFLAIILFGSPAHATVVQQAESHTRTTVAYPRHGEGLISLTARICGSSVLWRQTATVNRVYGPSFVVYYGRVYRVPCTRVSTTASRSATRVVTSSASTRARTVMSYALAQRGKQYCWGGSGPRCFDCSGLVMASYARIGIRLPHQSGQILRYGTRISRSQLRPGDLVWPQWGHVAIYLGNNRIVHAANPRQDVLVSNLYGFYAGRRLIR